MRDEAGGDDDDHGGFLPCDDEDEDDEEQEEDDVIEGGINLEACKEHGRRVIVHLDMDAYYFQCEELKDPTLADRPVGVSQKYLIVTANYVARAKGVTKLQSIAEALKRCPELKIINGEDLTPYRQYSEAIFELLRPYSPLVERLGLDETWYDVTARVERMMTTTMAEEQQADGAEPPLPTPVGHVYHPPGFQGTTYCTCGCVRRLFLGSVVADEMRRKLREALGFRCCGGIATNKMLAKLAGEMHKPNQQTTLLPQFVTGYLAPLPARKLPGCGWAINKQLQVLGVESVSDLRAMSLPLLVSAVGRKTAALLRRRCWGVDDDAVKEACGVYKTISEEDSFRNCTTREEVGQRMAGLVASLLPRIRERREATGELPHTLRLSLRNRAAGDGPRSRESRQCHVTSPDSFFFSGPASRVESRLWELFDRMVPIGRAAFDLSLLNVAVTDFDTPAGGTTSKQQQQPREAEAAAGAALTSPGILRFVRATAPSPTAATSPQEKEDGPGARKRPRGGEEEHGQTPGSGGRAGAGAGASKKRQAGAARPPSSSSSSSARRPLVLLTCERCHCRVRDYDMARHEAWHAEGGWHCEADDITEGGSPRDGSRGEGGSGSRMTMAGEQEEDAGLRRRVESLGFEWMVFRFLPAELQREILEERGMTMVG